MGFRNGFSPGWCSDTVDFFSFPLNIPGPFGFLLTLIFWGALLALVFVIVRSLFSSRRVPVEQTPVDILKKRYASGAIGQDEFRRMKEELNA